MDDLRKAFGVIGTLLYLQTPRDQTSILFSNRGGSGKTFLGVNIMAINAFRLSPLRFPPICEIENIGFVQTYWDEEAEKVRLGDKYVSPHPQVKYVRNLVEFWLAYAQLQKDYPRCYVAIDLDELQKWNPRNKHYTPLADAWASIWTENRKFRFIPKIYSQQMRKVPSPFVPTINWYISKSAKIADEYNSKYGTEYSPMQLAFVIGTEGLDLDDWSEDDFMLSDVRQVMFISRGPWTGDINHPVVGQFYYDPKGSAAFEIGTLNDDEDWHDKLLAHISKYPSWAIADAIFGFFEKRTKVSVTEWMSATYRIGQARAWRSYHQANGTVGKDGEIRIPLNIGKGKRLYSWKPTSGDISRLFDVPESTAQYQSRRSEKDATKTNSGQTPSETETAPDAGD
jgi:hypothetical protein